MKNDEEMLICHTRSSNRVLIGPSVIYSFDQYLSAYYPDTAYIRNIAEINKQFVFKTMWLQTGKG